MAVKKVDVASIKSDYETFKQEQAKALADTLNDLKAQRAELDNQIAHLETVSAELTGKAKPTAAPVKSGKR